MKNAPRNDAWRPPMPRKGKAILHEARDISSEYGWTDEALVLVHAARDAGWTLQEIADVVLCTREYIRQLCEREIDPATPAVSFPLKPKRPPAPKRPIPGHILRRQLVSDEEIAELVSLRGMATKRRRNSDPVAVGAAEELYRRVNHLVTLGVSPSWLSKRMGLSPSTLKAGLGRYGYRPIPPSQDQRLTGEMNL